MHDTTLRQPLEPRNVSLQSYMEAAHQAEVAFAPTTDDLSTYQADDFNPIPTNWKQIINLPENLKRHWISSLKEEVKTLFRMQTFEIVTLETDNVIIPTTTKFRTKLKSTGEIEKLTTRV